MATPAKFAPPNAEDLRSMRRGLDFLQAFRTVEPSLPSSYMVAFMAVAMEPGHGTVYYAKKLGMVQPVVSRILLEIGQKTRTGGAGLGLVDSATDPVDLRLRRYFLTPKGTALLNSLLKISNRK